MCSISHNYYQTDSSGYNKQMYTALPVLLQSCPVLLRPPLFLEYPG